MPVFCVIWKNNDNAIRGKQCFLPLRLWFPHLLWSLSVDQALLLLKMSAAEGAVGWGCQGLGTRPGKCPDLQKTDGTGYKSLSLRSTRDRDEKRQCLENGQPQRENNKEESIQVHGMHKCLLSQECSQKSITSFQTRC